MEEAIIRIEGVNKTFYNRYAANSGGNNEVQALTDVNLDIHKGEIYGIIGMSGAGKSTLVRCLNFLEKPTQGKVIVQGHDLGSLSEKELLQMRRHISMIFQHFNLLMQRTVIDNICFPLSIAGVKKADARKKAEELLAIVGMSDKAESYPAQLSGGQKQRVAIARALASDPEILLCDEATSALDPQTTKAILALLKEINQKMGITIVVITHEMAVVQEICTHVAILDRGHLVEHGKVLDIFSNPQTPEARSLVYSGNTRIPIMKSNRCVRIVFNENSSFEPVISNMVLECKSPVNILYANTRDINGTAAGDMILQLPEDGDQADRMIEFLKSRKLTVEEIENYVDNN